MNRIVLDDRSLAFPAGKFINATSKKSVNHNRESALFSLTFNSHGLIKQFTADLKTARWVAAA